ncbi:hypothetical protein ACFYN0_26455 [Streptomyces sp. NPDC006704]|uniref:hypothetical protein n=1 Tax=Streptomyces sp. NPDC006704 TaxID=3364760 RepID=UPI00367695F2
MRISLGRGIAMATGAALLAIGAVAGHVGASSVRADTTWNDIVAPTDGGAVTPAVEETPAAPLDTTWD